jgi:hypothetical protein
MGVIVILWRTLISCCLHLTARETEIGLQQFILHAQNLVKLYCLCGSLLSKPKLKLLSKPSRKCILGHCSYFELDAVQLFWLLVSSSLCYANARNIFGLESSDYGLLLSVFPAGFLFVCIIKLLPLWSPHMMRSICRLQLYRSSSCTLVLEHGETRNSWSKVCIPILVSIVAMNFLTANVSY